MDSDTREFGSELGNSYPISRKVGAIPARKHFFMEERIKPLYDSDDYESFCKIQKQKGLKKRHWHELPGMYIEHLEWREEFEKALEKFIKN